MSKRKLSAGIYMRMLRKWTRNSQARKQLAILFVGVITGALVFCHGGAHAAPGASRASGAHPENSGSHDEAAEQEIYKLTNQERGKERRPDLHWDDRLAQAALQHAQLMVEREELSHQFSGEPSVPKRLAALNLHFDRSGENVAYDANAQEAHRGLMNSPPHRANILNPDYNAIGIAAVWKGDLLYVVEDFAHLLPDYSSSHVEEMIAVELQKIRAANNLKPLIGITDPGLREQACTMARQDRLITSGLRTVKQPRYTVSYTATDPAKLPSDTMRPVTNPKGRGFSVGACFAKSASHPNALYWVALTFY